METFDTLTNELGLVNLEIGNGTVNTSVFADIDWGTNSYFLQIEMDENGGLCYQLMGTIQCKIQLKNTFALPFKY